MNRFLHVSIVLFATLFLSGCLTLAAQSVAHSFATGKSYAEVIDSIPRPAPQSGRLFVYITPDSERTSLIGNPVTGGGLVTDEPLCVIDTQIIELTYKAFYYKELPFGEHRVSCDVVIYSKGLFSGRGYKLGKNILSVSIASGSDAFIRISEKQGVITPVLIENDAARTEISKLLQQKNSTGTGLTISGDTFIDSPSDK